MQTLDKFVAAATSQKKEAFAKQFPNPFLLFKLEQLPAEQDEWSFQTRILVARKVDGTPAMLKEDGALYRLFALVKGPQNPWPERISIGRARNNDVVLPDNSVSKLHCHYTWDAAGNHYLTDTGSRNGTFVNKVRLATNTRGSIKINDQISFGVVQTTFIAAPQLYALIQTHLQK